PKLVQHTYRCPNAQFTCIDCSTTFTGKSYLDHNSCISEAEKYQKGLYKGNKKGKQNQLNKPKQDNNTNISLESIKQDQSPDTTNNNQESKDNTNSPSKKKNKNKKKLQDNQHKDETEGEKEGSTGVLIIDFDHKKVKESADLIAKQENDNKNENVLNSSPKKKKKKRSSVNISSNDIKVEINCNDATMTGIDEVNGAQLFQIEKVIETSTKSSNFKVEENKKNSDGDATVTGSDEAKEANEAQSVETEKAIETPKKESNTVNLDKSGKKKKKERNRSSINLISNDIEESKEDSDGDSMMTGTPKKETNTKNPDKGSNKKKKRSSVNININSNNIKGEESKKDNYGDATIKDSNDVNEVQSAQTEKVIKTPKKESNTVKLDKSSNKKKERNRSSVNISSIDIKVEDIEKNGDGDGDATMSDSNEKDSMIQSESSIEVLMKEISDKKDRKRKSIEPILPEKGELKTLTNKKQKIIDKTKDQKNAKFVHKTFDPTSIPEVIKKIFKSNEHDEINLKRLEEMVVRELIPNSNLSENELSERFLENIVLTMKDGNIILK
ncbi:4617_t:CDS:2, partial [Funneliformis geosporum]